MTGRLEGISGGKFSPLIMPGPLLISILGVAFCAWSALGNSLDFCITAGCELNSDTALWGISLWWYGAVAFCILTILALSGRPWLGVCAAGFCVILDLFLIILMLTTSPCVSCLIVGLLFVLNYMAFRYAGKGLNPLPRSILIAVWMVFFIANVGIIIRDSFGTWAVYGAEKPSISVFFSPSCPHCLTAVQALVSNKDAAFYPIDEKDGDFDAIARMLHNIARGDNILVAMEKAKKASENPLGFFDNAYLYFRLTRNKAEVIMSGSNVVPFIEYQGLPAALIPPKEKPKPKSPPPPKVETEPMETLESMDPIHQQNTTPNVEGNTDATLPIDTGIAGSCGGEAEKPCPEDVQPY